MDLLCNFDLGKIKFIDVSFDGGIQSYKQFRGGDIKKITQNINSLHKKGLREINALHVLSERTISFLPDMIGLNSYSLFNKMMFSPYLDTNSFKNRSEQIISLSKILQALKNCNDFMSTRNAFLLLDKYNFLSELELTVNSIDSFIEELNLTRKVFLIKEDPIEYGFVRITYDGYALTPTDSLNTVEYDKKRIPVHEFSNDIFYEMIFGEKQIEIIA